MVFLLLHLVLWGLLPLQSTSLTSKAQALIDVYYDSSNHLHRDLYYHPEQPARITHCVRALQNLRDERIRLVDVSSDAPIWIDDIRNDHEPFTDAQLADAKQVLLQTHDNDLVALLEQRCHQSKEARLANGKAEGLGFVGHLDADTYVTTESFDVALRATAAWLRAADTASAGQRNDGGDRRRAFALALTRPPGHHATRGSANGFCLYNFAAAAAVHVLRTNPAARVSVLDWDVHYGQGTADIVQGFDRARYASVHQTPAFPYEGERREVVGRHQNICNIPMPPATSWTGGYKRLFQEALDFCCNQEWIPDVVIVSAGFDALDSDELAQCCLQAPDFGRMATRLCEHVHRHSPKLPPALVLGLEGGYQLKTMAGGGNLPDALVETIQALLRASAQWSSDNVANTDRRKDFGMRKA